MTNTVGSSLVGAGVGATLMFLFDPARGARRRALVGDKMRRAARKTRDAYGATRRDLGNRLSGVAAELTSMTQEEPSDDRALEARVRAELGRVCSHPRAVRVAAADGSVTLSGDVLASEASRIAIAVCGVQGVTTVINQLATHTADENVPALQRRSSRPASWSSWIGEGWSPTATLTAAVGVASLAVAAALRRT
jgi:hypothetical protein